MAGIEAHFHIRDIKNSKEIIVKLFVGLTPIHAY
jgi:hypothetical protein